MMISYQELVRTFPNGPELISLTLAQWAEEHGVMLEFVRPGKPRQNAFIEGFNRTCRKERHEKVNLERTANPVDSKNATAIRDINSD